MSRNIFIRNLRFIISDKRMKCFGAPEWHMGQSNVMSHHNRMQKVPNFGVKDSWYGLGI